MIREIRRYIPKILNELLLGIIDTQTTNGQLRVSLGSVVNTKIGVCLI